MRVALIFLWIARIFALLIFLFWGAFFCEHLFEWFLHSKDGLPPVSVWFSMVLHLVMLIGLVIMLKWDRLGAFITILGTVAFFLSIGYHGFPFIAMINILPILSLSIYWLINYFVARN